MGISKRQTELVNAASKILSENLGIARNDAVKMIADELKQELQNYNLTLFELEAGSKSKRVSFMRRFSARFQQKLEATNIYPDSLITKSVENLWEVLNSVD